MIVKRQDGKTCEIILPYKSGSMILGRDKDREHLIHILGSYDTPNRASEVFRLLIGSNISTAYEMPLL